jgi:hypothetical protein
MRSSLVRTNRLQVMAVTVRSLPEYFEGQLAAVRTAG